MLCWYQVSIARVINSLVCVFSPTGMPGLTGEKEVSAVVGAPLTLTCSYPCKYYSFQKFWCKWNNTSCQPLISYEQNQTGRVVDCNQDNRTFSLKFDHVAQTDQGWYWCGVSRNGHYGETLAVNVQVRGGELYYRFLNKKTRGAKEGKKGK
uniref:Ig-like domain-containing protein n=1 Tax=Crocodylus porosus TaxID=8502 RepID=A0A7M4DVC0_CROPO